MYTYVWHQIKRGNSYLRGGMILDKMLRMNITDPDNNPDLGYMQVTPIFVSHHYHRYEVFTYHSVSHETALKATAKQKRYKTHWWPIRKNVKAITNRKRNPRHEGDDQCYGENDSSNRSRQCQHHGSNQSKITCQSIETSGSIQSEDSEWRDTD